MTTRKFSYLPGTIKTPFNLHNPFEQNFQMCDADFCSLPLYFAMKGKHDYEMVNRDVFIAEIRVVMKQILPLYDVVVIPESRYPFLRQVCEDICDVVELKKRNKEDICADALAYSNWSKLERISAQKAWDEMGDTFTINKIKANKRKDYLPWIFERVKLDIDQHAEVLLLDDFIMSGSTLEALAHALRMWPMFEYDTMGIFKQK